MWISVALVPANHINIKQKMIIFIVSEDIFMGHPVHRPAIYFAWRCFRLLLFFFLDDNHVFFFFFICPQTCVRGKLLLSSGQLRDFFGYRNENDSCSIMRIRTCQWLTFSYRCPPLFGFHNPSVISNNRWKFNRNKSSTSFRAFLSYVYVEFWNRMELIFFWIISFW